MQRPLVQGIPVEVAPATDEALLRAIGLSALAFQQTNTLDLSCSGLGGIGETVSILPQLAAALQIKGTPLLSLDISGNRLVDDDVALLVRGLGATCPALAVLNISGPAVQTGGFAQKLGGATAAALAAVLPSLPCLTTLRLAHNGIGEEGGRVLAEAAGKAPALREVDLYGNDIGEAAAATLVSHLRGRTGADTCGGRVFAALQASDGLLNLKGGQGGTDMGGGATAADLWLVAASVRVAPTAVQRLDVSTNPLSDAAVGQLALALSEGPGGGGVLLTLSLNRCGLVELDPFAKGVAAGGWASLATLSLGGNRLADAAAVSLAGLLPRLPALQFLHAYENEIGNAGAAALAGGLFKNGVRMRELRLNQNCIGDAGIEALGQGLAASPGTAAIDELWLAGNRFAEGGTFSTPPALKALKAACKAKKVRLRSSSTLHPTRFASG